MNDPTQPSIRDRSEIVRFFRWLFSWHVIRRILIVLAWTATVIALLYGEENWRGRHAWNKYRQELEARGAQLDLKTFIPKPVPDDQNFAATPFIQSWFVRSTNPGPTFPDRWTDDYYRVAVQVHSRKHIAVQYDVGNRHFMDLVAYQMGFDALRAGKLDPNENLESDKSDFESRAKAAPAVLEGLKTNEAGFAELRAASARPYSRYPVIYDLDNPWGILLPHLAGIKRTCQRLQLRACAELAAGKNEKALEDVKLMLHLGDSIKEEPLLISYVVRLACVQVAVQPVWEGLAEHQWSDAQLQELQALLLQYDFVADLKWPLEAERAAGILTADLLASGKYHFRTLGMLGEPSSSGAAKTDLAGRFMPRGWYYQEKLNYCRLFQLQLEGAFDVARKRISPKQIELNSSELAQQLPGSAGNGNAVVIHHRIIATLLLPALGKVPLRAATAQTAADQPALACALERYRLANGQFPENLEALVPKFISQLPNDVITGKPYKYRRTPDGQFVLYSVGWNEKDDGGTPGKTLFDEKQGDWVWQYPAK